MKNSEGPNFGDEGQSALSEQKGTEKSLPIRGTVKYNFTIQVFLSWENVQSITYIRYLFSDCCLQHALHTSLSCPSLSHILSLEKCMIQTQPALSILCHVLIACRSQKSKSISKLSINFIKKTSDGQLYSENTHTWVTLPEVAVWEIRKRPLQNQAVAKNYVRNQRQCTYL